MTERRKTKGIPGAIDKHVGHKLRVRRSLLGLSQEKLGDSIGLTFQQIQKYERGVNRISAGRLYEFGHILGVPVTYFYTGIEEGSDSKNLILSDNDQESFGGEDTSPDNDVRELVRAFERINDPSVRKDVLNLVISLSKAKR